jgi:signal transduction histidine kinase
VASWFVYQHGVEGKRRELQQRAIAVAEYFEPQLREGKMPQDQILHSMSDISGAIIWIADSSRKVLAGNAPPYWRRLPADTEHLGDLFDGKPQSWVRSARRITDRSIVVAVPVRINSQPAAVFLYFPYTIVERASDAVVRLLFWPFVIGILSALLLGWLISRSLTKPLANISLAAARFSAGDYSARTSAVGKDEVGSLGRIFNNMAESIAKAETNRREFLSTASHELRTPVASIGAMTEALLDDLVTSPEDRHRYLERILKESRRMGLLVNDILDLSRMEAGEFSIHIQPVSLQSIAHSTVERFADSSAVKSVTIKIESPDNAIMVMADPDRLGQITANFLSNAIRHTPDSSQILISIETIGPLATLSIIDEGEGIPEKELPLIWDRFYRIEKSRNRSSGGTGLGLAICRKLANMMGGNVSVQNEKEKGARFTVALPCIKEITPTA